MGRVGRISTVLRITVDRKRKRDSHMREQEAYRAGWPHLALYEVKFFSVVVDDGEAIGIVRGTIIAHCGLHAERLYTDSAHILPRFQECSTVSRSRGAAVTTTTHQSQQQKPLDVPS